MGFFDKAPQDPGELADLPMANGRHSADDTSKGILINGKFLFLFEFHRGFFRKGPIDNRAPMVQVMA